VVQNFRKIMMARYSGSNTNFATVKTKKKFSTKNFTNSGDMSTNIVMPQKKVG